MKKIITVILVALLTLASLLGGPNDSVISTPICPSPLCSGGE